MLYSFENGAARPDCGADDCQGGAQACVEPTDEALMEMLELGDSGALARLHQRHAALLRSVILRVVNNEDEADDVLQEVFLEVWRNVSRYSAAKGKALGWLVTMSRRRAIDRLRRNQAYGRASERMRLEVETQPPRLHDAEKEIAGADLRETLSAILRTLPAAQRQAVELAYYKGLSQREIASATGIPLGTIKTRIELGVRKIGAALRESVGRESVVLALGGS